MPTEKRPSALGTHSHHHSPKQDAKDNQLTSDRTLKVGQQQQKTSDADPPHCPLSCPLPWPSGRWIVGDEVEHDECSLAGQQRAQSMRRFCRRVHTLD